MVKKFTFTKAKIDALPLPDKGKRTYYYDEVEKGLIIDVRSSGSKSFYLYKKVDGKPERILLGQHPDVKVPQARKLASVKKGEIAGGKNPQDDKRKIREEMTFGELFHQYMERYSKRHKKSWAYDLREVDRFLSHWYKRKISKIKKQDIQKLHDQISINNGLYQANRILERVKAIYNKGIEWGYEGANPAQGIKKFKEKARDRFVQPNEMPFLMNALEGDENKSAKDYILISLMTGARKSNILSMRWEDIQWEQAKWRIPETKNGESLNVPLIPQAIEILKKLKQKTNKDWVFPADSSTGHMADPKKTWERIRRRATLDIWKQSPEHAEIIQDVEKHLTEANNYGFTVVKLVSSVLEEAEKRKIKLPTALMDLRLHDLRRTFGSYQAMTGASLLVIGRTLGHKSVQSTQIYARLNDDPMREAMEKAVGSMFKDVG